MGNMDNDSLKSLLDEIHYVIIFTKLNIVSKYILYIDKLDYLKSHLVKQNFNKKI